MVIGVLSDTHNNHRLMWEAVRHLREVVGADLFFHLGDYYEDGEMIAHAGYTVLYVPGLWCQQYRDPHIPKCIVHDIDGIRLVAAHADKDIRYTDCHSVLILTGHTHEACVYKEHGIIYVNPGHLKRDMDRGEHASYASIQIDSDAIHVVIYEKNGIPRCKHHFLRDNAP